MNKTIAAINLKYAIQNSMQKRELMSDHMNPPKFNSLISELLYEPDAISESIATYVECNMFDIALVCIDEFLTSRNFIQ